MKNISKKTKTKKLFVIKGIALLMAIFGVWALLVACDAATATEDEILNSTYAPPAWIKGDWSEVGATTTPTTFKFTDSDVISEDGAFSSSFQTPAAKITENATVDHYYVTVDISGFASTQYKFDKVNATTLNYTKIGFNTTTTELTKQ